MKVITTRSLTFLDFIRLPLSVYSAAGVKMFLWDDQDFMSWWEKFLLVFQFVNLSTNFFAKALFFVFGQFEGTVHLTKWALYFIFANNGFCKVFSVALGRHQLFSVLKDLEKIYPKTHQERQEFRLVPCYQYIMKHSKIMSIQHFTIALIFVVFPIVQSTIEYLTSDDENANFVPYTPYIMVYPFDVSRGIGYAYAYISQTLGGFTVSCYIVGSDMLLMCSIYQVIMHFDHLCLRIENFQSKGYEEDMQEISMVLERHNLLNKLAESVNNIFSISILLNYMISIFIIVMISIQISTGSDFGLDFIKFVGFFTSATTQVYYICMFGTLLMEHSGQVCEALIGQQWYMADVRYQRMLVLAIARSQRPSHLTAFKFFTISMETFSNLMTTAYQFFTLLKTQMEEQ
ncbi:odorant receptor 85c [Stomoxys calcitrans]|uniref:Odorant receptor n=1 Tax=Stomoxys calcitrans TaxID=35570 RepID=A0A1I8NMG4_STOCA|nr:odorant receptor 85c [Stomoxys calcitrans]